MIFPNNLNSPKDGIKEVELGNNTGISFEESEETFTARGQRICKEQDEVVKRLMEFNRKALNLVDRLVRR